jgi:hypothetical protein
MPDFTVRRYGTDSSGRTIYMTVYMHGWWEHVVDLLGFRPVIVQGAFMVRDGGGAEASSGAHDEAGSIDVRTRDLSAAQIEKLVRVCREQGAAAWHRDAQHGGMDPHCHITLGTDRPLSPMAQTLWGSYVSGGDGLAGPYDDYEWRPSPLVLTPPEDDDMAFTDWPKKDQDALLDAIEKRVMGHLVNRDATPVHFDAAVGNLLEVVRQIAKKVGA